ncbi:unnamed protein product, partial [Prunus brigantina]
SVSSHSLFYLSPSQEALGLSYAALSLSLSLSLSDAVVFLFHRSPAKGNPLYEDADIEAVLEVLYMVIHPF